MICPKKLPRKLWTLRGLRPFRPHPGSRNASTALDRSF